MATFLLEALGNNLGLPREYGGKESICQCRRCKRCRLNWPLCWEDSLKEGMATHSRILILEIPWTQKTGMLQSMGSKRVGHRWVTEHTNTHTHTHTHTHGRIIFLPFSGSRGHLKFLACDSLLFQSLPLQFFVCCVSSDSLSPFSV